MDKAPYEELVRIFEEAHKLIPPGTRWRHYKGEEYTAWRLAIVEATNEVAVVYSSLLYPEISFVRPYREWQELVESANGSVARFQRV